MREIEKDSKWKQPERGTSRTEGGRIDSQSRAEGGGGRSETAQGAPVSLAHCVHCQASSARGQKQHYRAVCPAKRRNNSCCVSEPLEHPNSWEIEGLSVKPLNGTHRHTYIFSLPFPESPVHLLLMQGSYRSRSSRLPSLPLTPCPFIMPCVILCVPPSPPHHLCGETQRRATEKKRKREILLSSMRKAETGRGSEPCQQIKRGPKAPAGRMPKPFYHEGLWKAEENMRSANCAGMSSLTAIELTNNNR